MHTENFVWKYVHFKDRYLTQTSLAHYASELSEEM